MDSDQFLGAILKGTAMVPGGSRFKPAKVPEGSMKEPVGSSMGRRGSIKKSKMDPKWVISDPEDPGRNQ